MTPADLALHLLSHPTVYEKLCTQDLHFSATPLKAADLIKSPLDRVFGHIPRHQLRAAAKLIDTPEEPLRPGPPFFSSLQILARHYLNWTRGRLRFRPEHYLKWREEADSYLSIDLLWITALTLECLEDESGEIRRIDPQRFKNLLLEPILPLVGLPALDHLIEEGLPELHRHASLSTLPERRWIELLQGDLQDLKQIHDLDNLRSKLEHARTLRHELVCFLKDKPRPTHPSSDFNLLHSYPRDLLAQERGLLHELLVYFSKNPYHPLWLSNSLHQYLLIRSEVHKRCRQHSTGEKGLDRFKEDYVDPQWIKNPDANIIDLKQAFTSGGVHWIELRYGTSNPEETLHMIAQALTRSRQSEHMVFETSPPLSTKHLSQPDGQQQVPGVRVIFHFLKRNLPDPKTESRLNWVRYRELRTQVRTHAEKLWNALTSPLGEMIVALDVASYELEAPTEIFSPWLRALRTMAPHYANHFDHPSGTRSGLGLTIHAGEEFHSLLEGMRAIDESIRFAGMQAGDRIGHGLALGLDPEEWRQNHDGVVLQPRLSRLDDLVWVYPLLCELGLAKLASQAENEMEKLADILYNQSTDQSSHRPSHRQLFRAWELRKYLHDSQESYETPLLQQVRCMQKEGLRHFGDAEPLWKQYLSDETLFEKGQEFIEVTIDADWANGIRKIQDHYLLSMAQKGIVIETNPSSNVAISAVSAYTKHPIFRWYPPDTIFNSQMPAVVVGSDDPSIFGTELYHEYAALACAAQALGYSQTQIIDWLWRLRESGRKHLFGASPNREVPSFI